MKKLKTMGFIEGAMILAVANILVKVIGAAFKIPLDAWILETDGMALYNTSYTIYNLLFVISTAGLPTAISKMVAEANSHNDYDRSNKILKISFSLLFVIGLIGTLVLSFGSKFFSARVIGYSDAWYTMLALSPSLLFVSCMSAFRGYFQGMQNMLPTAVSEVIEALCKLFIGFLLAYLFLPMGKPIASAGAILGVTTGGLCALVFLFSYYLTHKKLLPKVIEKTKQTTKAILKQLVVIAVPITIGASVFTLTSLIDTVMVTNQMKGYINTDTMTSSVKMHLDEERFEKYSVGFSDELSENPDLTETEKQEKLKENKAALIYGYLGRAITLFNMPPTVIAAIAISVVPAIAYANASKKKKSAQGYTKSAIRITILLSLPCAIGMSVLAEPVLRLLYNDPGYSSLLNVMAISIAFVTLVQIGNAILQAWGKVWIPVINMLIGGIVKVFVNLLLVGIPEVNINGAPIGTMLCYLTIVVLNLIMIKKNTRVRYEAVETFVKPLVSGVVMGAFAYGAYAFLNSLINNYVISMLLAVCVGASVYLLMLFVTKALHEEDVLMLPKGRWLADKMIAHNLCKRGLANETED